MTPFFVVTTDKTTFYSIEVEAESEQQAIEVSRTTPIESWNEDNEEFSFFYDVEKVTNG